MRGYPARLGLSLGRLGCLVAPAGASAAASRDVPLGWSDGGRGEFNGTLSITGFALVDDQLVAVGRLTGTTTGRHNTGIVDQAVTPQVLDLGVIGSTLHLDVGPLEARGSTTTLRRPSESASISRPRAATWSSRSPTPYGAGRRDSICSGSSTASSTRTPDPDLGERPPPVDPGDGELRQQLSNAIGGLFKQYPGRGPSDCRTYLEPDLVIVVMAGGYTAAEQTLFEAGKWHEVRQAPLAWQDSMESRFIETIQRLTGRTVTAFLSASRQNADITVELFVLESEARAAA
jgi:uncharacterized protein YbcI